jgi:hypothetical protein
MNPTTLTRWLRWSALAAGLPATMLAAQSAPGYSAKDYADAAALLEANTRGLVKNESVEPHWIGVAGDFWYRRDEADGVSYVRVNGKNGKKTPLFDHAALATALGQALAGQPLPTPNHLGLAGLALSADLKRLTASAGAKTVTCEFR